MISRALIKVGYSCNNNCLFCHSGGKRGYKDLSLYEIKKRILKAKKLGHNDIHLSGGEPTIRKDFLEICKFISKNNMSFSLATNARMMQYPDFTNELIKLGLNFTYISLYGHNADIHEAITRSKGSFNQTVKGIKNLLRRNLDIKLNVVVNKKNLEYLKDITKFCNREIPKLKKIKFTLVKPEGLGIKNFKKIVPKASIASKKIIEGIRYGKSKGYKMFSMGLPLCLLRNFENTIDDLKTNSIKVMMEAYDDCFHPIETEDKIKGKKCKSCLKYKKCEGMYRIYVKRLGWKEFKPIKK